MVEIPNTYFIYAGYGLASFAGVYLLVKFYNFYKARSEVQRKKQEKIDKAAKMRMAKVAKQPSKEVEPPDDSNIWIKAKPREFLNEIPRWRWIKRWKRNSKFNDVNKPVLARLHMESGHLREVLVNEEAQGFKYRKGSYILDGKSKYFNSDVGLFCYDFHESLAMPFFNKVTINKDIYNFFNLVNSLSEKELKDPLKHGLDVNAEMDKIESSGVIEVETALHPTIFQRIHDNKIVQAILSGAAIPKLVKILIVIAVIILLAVGIDVLIDLWDSGLLDEIAGGIKGK